MPDASIPIVFLLQDTGAIYGAQQATLDLLGGLVRDGAFAPRVFLMQETRRPDLGSEYHRALAAAGAEPLVLPVTRRFCRSTVQRVAGLLRKAGVHLLHSVGPKADVHAIAIRFRTPGLKCVSTLHGWLRREDLKERFQEWLNLQALKRMDRVVVLSRFYENLLAQKGLKPGAVVRIPSGFRVDGVPSWPRRWKGQGTFRVGMLGRFSEEKNHAMILDVAERLRDEPFAFLLAGTGPTREWVIRQIEARELRQVQVLPYTDRYQFFDRIDVLAMCSQIENLPYTVLEAMACGRPVVATRVGGLPDLVDDPATGRLVAPGDAAAMAEVLREWYRRPEAWTACRDAASEKLVREFDPDRHLQAHLALYRDLA